MELDLSKIKKVFFIGIGGIGISGLAQMVLSMGMKVEGVNDDESPDTLDPLQKNGINISFLKDFKDLPHADLYVYSDAWLYRGPDVIKKAKETGIPVFSYFEALGEFSKKYKVIAISGTHGKTTTTAMVANILIDADLDPTVLIGSFIKSFSSNFRKGNGDYLVVEADEYNRHMLNFNPYIGAITNIEEDHLDYYKDLTDIQKAFDQFLIQSENKVSIYDKYLDKVPKLLVPGEHNRKNGALALAIADILNIDEKISKKSLQNFTGTWRRLEKRGETENGTVIYDDYAHHPTEIKASLEALREIYPTQKITVVFQPHLYSRTKAFFDGFVSILSKIDEVYLLPVFFAREEKDESVSSKKLAEAINLKGGKAKSFLDFVSTDTYIKSLKLGENDIFVTMGAGEAYRVADNCFEF